MAGFKDVIGQKSVIAHMKKALQLHTVSHAYIINGEKGMGKKLIADIFSTALQCEAGGDEPCMECRSCKQAAGRNHPDIKWITHEKPNLISVDEIREQLVNDMGIKPYSSKYKIYIIDEGEKMNAAAQNTLLKTIEEPPAYGIVIILTANREMLLQTILSRCVSLNLRAISLDEVKKYLMERVNVPDYRADMAAKFGGGNLGKSIDIASSDDFNQMKDDVVRVMKNLDKMSVSDINQTVKDMAVYKDNIDSYLNLIVTWFRDVLLCKAVSSEAGIVFREEAMSIHKQALRTTYDGLESIFREIDELKVRIKSNVNFDMSMELLFIKIRFSKHSNYDSTDC